MKCKVRKCTNEPMYRFGEKVVTCADHADTYKQQYNRWSLIVNEDDHKHKNRKLEANVCSVCSAEATAYDVRREVYYCETHNLDNFARRLNQKQEVAEVVLKQMEKAALQVVLAAED